MLCAVCGLELPVKTELIKFLEARRQDLRVIQYNILNPIYRTFPAPYVGPAPIPMPDLNAPPTHLRKEIRKVAGFWVHEDCVDLALDMMREEKHPFPYELIVELL